MISNKRTNKDTHEVETEVETNEGIASLLYKLFALILCFTYISISSSAHSIEPHQEHYVNKVIQAFKANDRVAISKMISYPLYRQSSLAPINTPSEFLERYDQVFDKQLLRTIVLSHPQKDWSNIGWQGVILANGIIGLDPEGNITEINYQSTNEIALINQLNPNVAAKGRRVLHRSVNVYKNALVELKTERFHIRVDDIGNGRLRYASWPLSKKMSSQPDLVLTNGRVLKNGRNQRYIFANGTYSYQLNINAESSNSPVNGRLDVLKAGNPWSSEAATYVHLKP